MLWVPLVVEVKVTAVAGENDRLGRVILTKHLQQCIWGAVAQFSTRYGYKLTQRNKDQIDTPDSLCTQQLVTLNPAPGFPRVRRSAGSESSEHAQESG